MYLGHLMLGLLNRNLYYNTGAKPILTLNFNVTLKFMSEQAWPLCTCITIMQRKKIKSYDLI